MSDRRSIEVQTAPSYRVRVGPGVLDEVGGALPPFSRCAVLTDETVAELHGSALGNTPLLALPPGEETKSFAHLERALDFLASSGLDRGSCVVALGGGVVGDLAGLAASLYMRGIALLQCPTTLLAQVDSSVGGKTAVNLRAGKNLAGTFHQPRAVFADTAVLSTLPDDEFASGLGEVVKTALIGGPELFELVERSAAAILARDPALLALAVERCIRVKARVVAADERESGERKSLNLGHTFGHALEREAGYGRIPHGVAVAAGLALAARYALRVGVLEEPELPQRLERVLGALGLPRALADLRRAGVGELAPEGLVDAMRLDKKGAAGEPRLVLPRRIGALALDVPADAADLVRFLATA